MWSKFVFALISATFIPSISACHDYVLVSVRGTSEPQGPSAVFSSMINTTLHTLPRGTEYDLVYPASLDLVNSTLVGYRNLVTWVHQQLKACPKQRYALLGYSQGAAVVDLALSNFTLGTPAYDAVNGVLVLGNPGHKPYQVSNYDECGGLATKGVIGAFYSQGLRIPDFWYQSTKVIDICHIGDNICGPYQVNSSFADHLKYASSANVQLMGSQFLVGSLTPMALLGADQHVARSVFALGV